MMQHCQTKLAHELAEKMLKEKTEENVQLNIKKENLDNDLKDANDRFESTNQTLVQLQE